MADSDVPKYASLLRLQFAFQDLDEAQMAHLISRLERIEIDKDALIVSQGQAGEYFYIIYSGKVRVTQLVGDEERQLVILGSGDYFGEEALLYDRPAQVTVIAASQPTILLRLSNQDFSTLILETPSVEAALKATIHSRQLAEARKFDWLGEEEVIYLLARKHVFFLMVSFIFPGVIGLIGLIGLGLGMSRSTSSFANLFVIFGILGLIAAILLAIWNCLAGESGLVIFQPERSSTDADPGGECEEPSAGANIQLRRHRGAHVHGGNLDAPCR
jgi:CRP-like cAMP-binding protein